MADASSQGTTALLTPKDIMAPCMICEDREEYKESDEDINSMGFDSETDQLDLTKVQSNIEKLKLDDY